MPVLKRAAFCFEDTLAVALAAAGQGIATAGARVARETGPGPSTIWGFGVDVSAGEAAFANGMMAHGLDFENIIIGCGSDELISFLCRCYAGVGDEVLFTEHGFGMYRIAAQTVGATPVAVPEKNRVTDVDALLAEAPPGATHAPRSQGLLFPLGVASLLLGLLFVLPVIGGAYLGQWLDSLAPEYSTRWTLSLILLGIMVGALNVYLFIRE